MTMTSIIILVLKASIILSVFAIGLKVTFADATFLFRRPGHLVRAFLSMSVLMPLIALVLGALLPLHPAVKIALVVIAVSPIPPILPNKALKAGGREDYTIGLWVAAAVLSVVVIPITIEIVERLIGIPLVMRARSVAVLVLTTILIPLLIGIAVRKFAHGFAERGAKPIGMLATALLVLSALPVLIGLARTIFPLIGDGTLLSLFVFALVGIVAGHLLGGPETDNRPVLALATASRHPGMALAIAHANFPEQRLAAPAIFLYVIVSVILTSVYLSWLKRRRAALAVAADKKPVGI